MSVYSASRSPRSKLPGKSLFQSRLAQMEKILFFRPKEPPTLTTVAPKSANVPSLRQSSPDTSLSGKSGQNKIMTSLSGGKQTHAGIPKQIDETPKQGNSKIGRNIRNEMKQNKFAGLAKLMKAKSKMPSVVEAETYEPLDLRPLKTRWPTLNNLTLSPVPELKMKLNDEKGCNQFRDSISAFSPENETQQLIGEWKRENLTQRKLSFILCQFSKNLTTGDKDRLAMVDNRQIVLTNKYLAVSALKQSLIEEQLKQKQAGLPFSSSTTSGGGSLSLSKIILPLRTTSASESTYICCILQYQGTIIDTTPAIAHCLPGSKEQEFKVEKVLNNLQTDFELQVHFYQMNGDSLKPVKGAFEKMRKKMSKLLKSLTGCATPACQSKCGNHLNYSGDLFQLLDSGKPHFEPNVQLAISAFKPFGSLTINRSFKWLSSDNRQFPIEPFDYLTSPSLKHATIDGELVLNLGKSKMIGTEGTFGFHVESRFLDLGRLSLKKYLTFDSFKYGKCSVVIDGQWLRCIRKQSTTNSLSCKFNLAHCLNGPHFAQSQLTDNPQVICLLFGQLTVHLVGSSFSHSQEFVFLRGSSKCELSQLFTRLMARVGELRKWEAPLSDKATQLVHFSGDSVKAEQMETYSGIISKIKVN